MAALDAARAAGSFSEFHIYGDKHLQQVNRAPLAGRPWAVFHPRMSHDESMEALSRCDWLLLTLADTPNTRATLHAKLPHYLALGKPILALVPGDSAVADVIRETGTGWILPDERAWAEGLIDLLASRPSNGSMPRRNEDAIRRYSWARVSSLWRASILGE